MSIIVTWGRKFVRSLPKKWEVRVFLWVEWTFPLISERHRKMKERLKELCGEKVVVLGGPFAGMRYLGSSFGSQLYPKIVGSYEKELHGCIEWMVRQRPGVIIDIGAGEGYYAVGMAMRIEGCKVIGFDMSLLANEWCKRLAKMNGVEERVVVRGVCDAKMLEETMAGMERPMVICDVEGAEEELLDPEAVTGLKKAVMLVEMHEGDRPGITKKLEKRFAVTHEVEVIEQVGRTAEDLPGEVRKKYGLEGDGGQGMKEKIVEELTDEQRLYRQTWLWMKPRR